MLSFADFRLRGGVAAFCCFFFQTTHCSAACLGSISQATGSSSATDQPTGSAAADQAAGGSGGICWAAHQLHLNGVDPEDQAGCRGHPRPCLSKDQTESMVALHAVKIRCGGTFAPIILQRQDGVHLYRTHGCARLGQATGAPVSGQVGIIVPGCIQQKCLGQRQLRWLSPFGVAKCEAVHRPLVDPCRFQQVAQTDTHRRFHRQVGAIRHGICLLHQRQRTQFGQGELLARHLLCAKIAHPQCQRFRQLANRLSRLTAGPTTCGISLGWVIRCGRDQFRRVFSIGTAAFQDQLHLDDMVAIQCTAHVIWCKLPIADAKPHSITQPAPVLCGAPFCIRAQRQKRLHWDRACRGPAARLSRSGVPCIKEPWIPIPGTVQ